MPTMDEFMQEINSRMEKEECQNELEGMISESTEVLEDMARRAKELLGDRLIDSTADTDALGKTMALLLPYLQLYINRGMSRNEITTALYNASLTIYSLGYLRRVEDEREKE